jgi:hypothetical protein
MASNDPIEINPVRRTPFRKLFTCCLPKAEMEPRATERGVVFSDPERMPEHMKQDIDDVTEEESSATGLDIEFHDSQHGRLFDLPDLDESFSEDDVRPQSVVVEFWKLIMYVPLCLSRGFVDNPNHGPFLTLFCCLS